MAWWVSVRRFCRFFARTFLPLAGTMSAFHGYIREVDGVQKVVLDIPWALDRFVQRMRVGQRVTQTLAPFRKDRSLPQNSYYHGVVLKTFGDHLGYTTEELHDAMKARFLVIDPDADIPRIKSTTKLSTVEFNEYIDKIVRLAAENGCDIPEPNEADTANLLRSEQ